MEPLVRYSFSGGGFIEFLAIEPRPADGMVVASAFASRNKFELKSTASAREQKLVHELYAKQHTSPFEMVETWWRVRAPLAIFWQWVRHRTFHYQSINSSSGRFTNFEMNDFYLPDHFYFRKQKEETRGSLIPPVEADKVRHKLAQHFMESLKLYDEMLGMGVSREDARWALPGFSMYYTWVIKVDLKNLFDFFRLRVAPDAQPNIREYAYVMMKAIGPYTPQALAAFLEQNPQISQGLIDYPVYVTHELEDWSGRENPGLSQIPLGSD